MAAPQSPPCLLTSGTACEGWLVFRRMDAPLRSFARVYARLTDDRLQWYRDPANPEVIGGFLVLGKYFVKVAPETKLSHDGHNGFAPQWLIFDTANSMEHFEMQCLPADGRPDVWESASTNQSGSCHNGLSKETSGKIARMYTLINELCILAGEYPATLLAAEPCDYMRNRTDGVEAGDTANEADATAAAIAKLSEIQEMLRIPRDATQSQAAPENHVAASNIVLKQVAVKLGLFSVIANFMESPILDVGQQASFTCLTLTLLSAEIAEKATPVMPGILKFITAEIDVAIASRKWFILFNLIKSPTIMRMLMGAGFPSFCVRILKRAWSVLGDPQLVKHSTTGVVEDLDPEEEKRYLQLERAISSAMLTMSIHGEEIHDAFDVCGARPMVSHYRHNANRNNPSMLIVNVMLIETDPPSPDDVLYLMSQWDSDAANAGETVLDAVIMRFHLACIKQPEPSPPTGTDLKPVTGGLVSLSRFYDIREVGQAMIPAAAIPEARAVIIGSTCIADCFASLHLLQQEGGGLAMTDFASTFMLVQVLSSLSFDQAGKDVIAGTPSAFEILKRIVQGDGGIALGENDRFVTEADRTEMHKAVTSLIFQTFPHKAHEVDVQIQDARRVRSRSRDAVTPSAPSQSRVGHQHCMISYCWADQAYVLKTAASLRAKGITVWLDVDNMSGSTLEAMASAVENAYSVIIVLSEAYKQSTACRTEAEYAYTLKKVVVPIKFDGTFTATGWLGALIGTKLFFNLGGLAEDQFNDKVHAVFTELQRVSHAQGLRASLPPGNHLSSAASAAAVVLATIRSAPKPTPVDHEVQSAVSTASTDLVGNDSARLAQLESEVRTAVSNAVNDIFAKARLAAPSSTAQ